MALSDFKNDAAGGSGATVYARSEGPYGFAWLLERVADFGAEEAFGRVPPTSWNIVKPPPPLQLLIPEAVTFEPEVDENDVSRRTSAMQIMPMPRALFFTDRGGFLRGSRRTIHQETKQVLEGLHNLTRQRLHQDREIYAAEASHVAQATAAAAAAVAAAAAADAAADEVEEYELQTSDACITEAHTSPNSRHGCVSSQGFFTDAVGTPRADGEMTPAGESVRKKPSSAASLFRKTAHVLGKAAALHRPSWRLQLQDGTEHRLPEELTAACFASSEGRKAAKHLAALAASGITTPPRMLQASLSFERHADDIASTGFVYKYDACKRSAQAQTIAGYRITRDDEARNNFERRKHFEGLDHRNLVSAVPILISQHLAFYCGLELVSGEFELVVDPRGKIWLIDTRELMLVPNGAPTGLGTGDSDVKKISRYLSEEALAKLEVPKLVGEKFQKMSEVMLLHYRAIKDESNVDELLQKTDEVADISVPVFEGTDPQALLRTFGNPSDTGEGAAAQNRHCGQTLIRGRRPRKSQVLKTSATGPGRHAVVLPRDPPRKRGVREHSGWFASWQPPRARNEPTRRMPEALAAAQEHLAHLPGARRRSESRKRSAEGEIPVGIEFISSQDTMKLLIGSGPRQLPDGPTLEKVGPQSLYSPAQRTKAQPRARLVKVATGTASMTGPPVVQDAASKQQHGHGAHRRRSEAVTRRKDSQPWNRPRMVSLDGTPHEIVLPS